LACLLWDSKCILEDLALNNADVQDLDLEKIIEPLVTVDRLRKLSLTKNTLTTTSCKLLHKMMTELHHFDSLWLRDCRLGTEGLSHICEAVS
jgi:Ran GTPase-activating protein (RanGAP) involved in mRNA processing and transport